MKISLIALVSLLGVCGAPPAFAQQASTTDWSGAYLGAQLGYGFGNTSSVTTNLVGTFPVPFDYSSDGALGGVHAGYNFQSGSFVLGIEGDAEVAAIEDQQSVYIYDVTYSSKTTADFVASLRARSGVAFDRLLIYGTGGVAFGQVEIAYDCDACVSEAGAASTLDDLRVGWTAGVGAEYSLTSDISLRLEYRYTDLGSKRLIDVEQVADYHDNRFTFGAVRFGASFHF